MGTLKEKIMAIVEDAGDSYREHLVKSAAKGTPPVRDEDTWREYRRARFSSAGLSEAGVRCMAGWIDEEARFDPDGGLCSSYGEYCVRCAARNWDPVPEWEWRSNVDVLHFIEKLNRQGFVLTNAGKGGRR